MINLGAREPFDGEVDLAGGRRASLGPLAALGPCGHRFQLDLAQLAGEDQAFHQGIAGQSIGPMHPGAGHLPNGIEARQACGGLQICCHPPHPVVGGRCHGDGGLGGFEAQLAAAPQDRGELLVQPVFPHGPEVEPEVIDPVLLHPAGEGSTHLVAGGEITACQISHGAVPLAIEQPGTFTAYGFGDQEPGGAGQH